MKTILTVLSCCCFVQLVIDKVFSQPHYVRIHFILTKLQPNNISAHSEISQKHINNTAQFYTTYKHQTLI